MNLILSTILGLVLVERCNFDGGDCCPTYGYFWDAHCSECECKTDDDCEDKKSLKWCIKRRKRCKKERIYEKCRKTCKKCNEEKHPGECKDDKNTGLCKNKKDTEKKCKIEIYQKKCKKTC